jgi:phosphate transport system permease protein
MKIENIYQLSTGRKIKSVVMTSLISMLAAVAVVPLFLVFYHVIKSGLPAINWRFFVNLPAPLGEKGGGMANALLGSAIMIALATMIALPIGIFGGLFLSEYGDGKIGKAFQFVTDLLTSIPSIVVGVFIYSVVVVPMKGFSAIAGTLALALMMFPVSVKTTESVLKLVPQHVREAGLALGLPRWRMILWIVLWGSRSAIATGVILSIARVAGETAPLLFTAFGNRTWLTSLLQPAPSLPVQIYAYAISPYEDWHQQAWAGAFLLLIAVFLFNVLARFILFRNKSGNHS